MTEENSVEILTWTPEEAIFKTTLESVGDEDAVTLFVGVGNVWIGEARFDHKPDGAEVANAAVKVVREWLEEASTRMAYLSGDDLTDSDLFDLDDGEWLYG